MRVRAHVPKACALILSAACKASAPTPDAHVVELPEAAPESAEHMLERVDRRRHPEFVCPAGTKLRAIEDAAHYTFFCENAEGKRHGFFVVYGRDGEYQVLDAYANGVPVR